MTTTRHALLGTTVLAALALLVVPLAGRQAAEPAPLSPAAQRAALKELVSLVSIPNVATSQGDIRRNADYLRDAFTRRGFTMQVIDTRHSPVLIGVRRGSPAPGARPVDVTFYCHYDGQPVVVSEWRDSGAFEAMVRDAPLERGGKVVAVPPAGGINPDWRLYARSSSDDKGPIAALLAAVDRAAGSGRAIAPTVRVVLEGDEEAGSPVLEEALKPHVADLKTDIVIMMDGPQHPSGRPTFFFGARGILSAELTVFGARHDLHSGNYGNWAPNPALELARLLASMKDDQGRVTIDGFYDEVVPLTAAEKDAIDQIPPVEEEQMRALGFARPEVPGSRIEARHNLPTFNVSGLGSGTVTGQGRTIIPAVATSRLDLRLVNAIDPDRQFARLKAHVERQGFHLVAGEAPTGEERAKWPKLARLAKSEGYPAGRTRIDEPTANAVIKAVAAATGKAAVRYPTLGGSAPFYIFSSRLALPTIGMPVVNADNNQHGPNENIRLGTYFEAVNAIEAILALRGSQM